MTLFYCCSFGCLTLALQRIDVSVDYAVWSGVGVALIATIGIGHFQEPLTPLKLFGTAAIKWGQELLARHRSEQNCASSCK